MAELVLDRLALQELHVVDDQEVDVAQLLLQRQRIVIADRGGEAPHEIFGGQVDDARFRIVPQRFRCDRLQEMRLAEPNGSVEEQRVEAHGAGGGFRDGARGSESHPVRRAFDEGAESVARVERGAQHVLAEIGFCGDAARHRCAFLLAGAEHGAGRKRGLRLLGDLAHRSGFQIRAGMARGTAHHDLDLENAGILLLPQLGDDIAIVAIDPRAQERRRHRHARDALGELDKLHAAEPAGIDLGAQARPQLRLDAFETLVCLIARSHCAFSYQVTGKRKAAAKLSVCATVYHQKSSFIFQFAPAG